MTMLIDPYRFHAVDPLFGSVSLLLHMNDLGLTDVKGHSVTLGGNVTRSSVQSKFGGFSALYDGTGDYLRIPYAAELDPGAGDFTIEGWVYVAAFKTFRSHIIGTYTFGSVDGGTNNDGWQLSVDNVGKLFFGWGSGGAFTDVVSSTVNVSLNTWTHVAVVRSGTAVSVYIEGVQRGTATYSNNITRVKSFLYLGSYLRGDGESFGVNISFSGYHDEMRITKGFARYTSNFTPVGPFPDF